MQHQQRRTQWRKNLPNKITSSDLLDKKLQKLLQWIFAQDIACDLRESAFPDGWNWSNLPTEKLFLKRDCSLMLHWDCDHGMAPLVAELPICNTQIFQVLWRKTSSTSHCIGWLVGYIWNHAVHRSRVWVWMFTAGEHPKLVNILNLPKSRH